MTTYQETDPYMTGKAFDPPPELLGDSAPTDVNYDAILSSLLSTPGTASRTALDAVGKA